MKAFRRHQASCKSWEEGRAELTSDDHIARLPNDVGQNHVDTRSRIRDQDNLLRLGLDRFRQRLADLERGGRARSNCRSV